MKKGYDQQMSFYGVLTDRETGESSYCRIEVLSNAPRTPELVHLVYDFFYVFKPGTAYSIWIYDKDREALRLVGSYR